MKLKLKKLKLQAGRPVAFIHNKDAEKLNIHVGDRVEILSKGKKIIAVVDVIESIKQNEIYLSREIIDYIKIRPGATVEVFMALEPKSTRFILKKLSGKPLSKKEIYSIIKDIVNNALTEAEVAYFISGVHKNGMSLKETIYLTEAMCKTGKTISWKNKKVVDKHSIGGIAGNRTTPIVISICSAAGAVMPKTSSRAITSAAGTADVMETVAKVDLSASELKKVVSKTNACMVWGGALGMAPSDDKLIRVERLLGLDPESQLIASIMAKKLSVGSKYVLIDIPYGKQAKVSRKKALILKRKFFAVAKHFKIKLDVILTPGFEPIGNGIGPVLEIKDVLRVLERNNPPSDLEKKCILLSGKILEMIGKAKKGKGKLLAEEILNSGKALKKFNEIISAQGKKKNHLKLAKFRHEIKAKKPGKIKDINNKEINRLGRILGCPTDKSAGLYLHKHLSDKLKKSEAIITLYSESKKKLKQGIDFFHQNHPIKTS